jgi:hypothetical protein
MDDFYSVSSGLAATETTLRVFNPALLQLIQPLGQIWEPVRCFKIYHYFINVHLKILTILVRKEPDPGPLSS